MSSGLFDLPKELKVFSLQRLLKLEGHANRQ